MDRLHDSTDLKYSVASQRMRSSAISLLGNRKFHALALWQTDPGSVTANNEDVGFPRRELVVHSIFDVHNIEASVVALTMSNDTHTPHVTSTSSHGDHASVELDEFCDLSRCQVDLDSVIDLDVRVGVSNTVLLSVTLGLVGRAENIFSLANTAPEAADRASGGGTRAEAQPTAIQSLVQRLIDALSAIAVEVELTFAHHA